MGNKEMVEELNKYFASVFMAEYTSNIPKELLEKLKGLKVDKSPAPDGLHPRVLQEIAEEIAEALVVIFQESLESGRVPEDWKAVNLILLFKNGVEQKTGNYRLSSLTSVFGKILESIGKEDIAEYYELHGKIRQSQYGFIKGRSYLTNLLEFFEEVTSRLEQGEPMDVINLYFQNAFDKVLHRRLLSK
eukprot:g38009.t1